MTNKFDVLKEKQGNLERVVAAARSLISQESTPEQRNAARDYAVNYALADPDFKPNVRDDEANNPARVDQYLAHASLKYKEDLEKYINNNRSNLISETPEDSLEEVVYLYNPAKIKDDRNYKDAAKAHQEFHDLNALMLKAREGDINGLAKKVSEGINKKIEERYKENRKLQELTKQIVFSRFDKEAILRYASALLEEYKTKMDELLPSSNEKAKYAKRILSAENNPEVLAGYFSVAARAAA